MKKNYHKIVFNSLLMLLSLTYATAQQIPVFDNSGENQFTVACQMPITDYVSNHLVPAPYAANGRLAGTEKSCATATINVIYNNFPNNPIQPSLPGPEQMAFQRAIDIWETLIVSTVPITIDANWQNQGANTLGSARAEFFAEIPGGGANTLYPAPLAEKLIGAEIGGANSIDITCTFNSQFSNWYFGEDPTGIASNEFDFTSVVLHEIAHGIGFAGFGIRLENGPGTADDVGNIRRDVSGLSAPSGSTFFSIWDTFVDGEDIFGSQVPILNETTFPDRTAQMLGAFTSNNLTVNAPTAVAENSGVDPKTFAPSTFNQGSTYSHWDENTFNGTPNALMTPQFGQGEVVRDPGVVALAFMEDMGWSLCTPLSTDEFTIADVVISPNPFAESLTINLPVGISNGDFNVSLIDMNGRIVLNQTPDNSNGVLTISNLSSLDSAMYFLKIESATSNVIVTKKVVKN